MRHPYIAHSRWRSILPLLNLGMVILSAWILTTTLPVSAKVSTPVAEKVPAPCQRGHQVGYLSTFHSELVDASSGCQVTLTGVNWFGFETGTFAPHGLWARNWQDMLKQIAQTGFNTIRMPYTNQLFDPTSIPNGINYQLNPDLKGLQGLALMDRIIQGAGKLGLKVMLDRHDPTADQRIARLVGEREDQQYSGGSDKERRYDGVSPDAVGATGGLGWGFAVAEDEEGGCG